MFSYPNVGATVWCFFQNNDQNFPVYFAATYGGTAAAGQFASCEPLPDKSDGAYVHKIVCGKTTVLLSESGNLKLETRAVNSENDSKNVLIEMDQSGNLKIQGSTSIDITTQDIRIAATNRLEIKSPAIEITTNLDGKGKNDNFIVMNTDSFKLDAESGRAITITKTNGVQQL